MRFDSHDASLQMPHVFWHNGGKLARVGGTELVQDSLCIPTASCNESNDYVDIRAQCCNTLSIKCVLLALPLWEESHLDHLGGIEELAAQLAPHDGGLLVLAGDGAFQSLLPHLELRPCPQRSLTVTAA